eukprot:CAMPEP_0171094930 /NCGR_PEP_ID=MMETSP0766_2-20121228/42887_1 /TAXON_ID=439317 /ORGANISM="Gambierdiscus australes, Strain CAWD 149" /LENGTH=257 /DNA_ID=CAMNT_0011553677 /DNA_START=56 /DNA_END=829 /DNA_ORIENTATION=+
MNLGLGLAVALSSCWEVSGQANYTLAAKASMRITGLNYTELEEMMGKQKATQAITDALADIMGTHVVPWVWRVIFSPGFVVLEMNLPDEAEQQNMVDTLDRMKNDEIPTSFKKYLEEAALTFTGDVMVEVNKVWKQEYNGCDFSFLGFGYCADDADTEISNRLSDDWAMGEIDAAEAACCADEFCVGYQLDTATGEGKAGSDYVLLHAMGTPNGEGEMRRMCYEKIAPATSEYVPNSALPLSTSGFALVLALAAVAH